MSFVDKYRPEKLEDIVGNVNAIKGLRRITGKPPHILFAGKPGTGKTTAALALCRELLGETWRSDVKMLNSSDQRGIDVVRSDIKQFARTKPLFGEFKILILDEADNMTPDAQHAMRGTMEMFSKTTSFILTANYPEKIIDAITSRCKVYNFKPVSVPQAVKLIGKICVAEGIRLDPSDAEKLAKTSHGDMRYVMHELETLKNLGEPKEGMLDFSAYVPSDEIRQYVHTLFDMDYQNAYKRAVKLVNDGVEPKRVLTAISNHLSEVEKPASIKLNIQIALQETDRNLSLATNPELQILGITARVFSQLMREKK